CAEELFDYW
nr:immunoglobulin heavy chain junction region [Mus musculus]